MSLTNCLAGATRRKEKDFFGIDKIIFPKMKGNTKIVNPYPSSLEERRLWGLMGIFTDYMIRKMFRDGDVSFTIKVIPETRVIADSARKLIPDNNLEGSPLVKTFDNLDVETMRVMRARGNEWIERYMKKPWDKCIHDTFYLSQMDSLFRAWMVGEFHELSDEEHDGLRIYLEEILKFLKEHFHDSTIAILNPVLSHKEICLADADLVIDDTLYEIKTVKHPVRAIRENKDQLLGYAALAQYHMNHPIESSPQIDPINAVGYLFPLSLSCYRTEIPSFGVKERLFFCERLKQLVEITLEEKQKRFMERVKWIKWS